MTLLRIGVAACMTLLLGPVACATAQETAIGSLRYQTPYVIAKPHIEHAFTSGTSFDQRRAAVLKAAEVAYGSRARIALGSSVDVLARIPGGMKVARELAINNSSNRKGALRAALVAGAVESDRRFAMVALEQLVRNRAGAIITDRDVVFRHGNSGTLGRLEVKDATPATQTANLAKYKRQIDLMAAERRSTGQPQAFVNRRPLIPELARYAESQRIPAYGNVRTSLGESSAPGEIPITQVLDDLDRRATRQMRLQAATTAFGVFIAVRDGRRAFEEWSDYLAGQGSATSATSHALLASSGTSFAVEGMASTVAARLNASNRGAALVGRIGRVAGPAGYVLLAGSVGLQGYQFYSGEINTRQFVYATTTTGGAFAGGVVGMFGGAAIGTWGGPAAWFTVPAGAFIGGIAGAWTGQTMVTYGVESYFSLLDADQQQILFDSLHDYYRAKAQ